jgi:hypothetical protein
MPKTGEECGAPAVDMCYEYGRLDRVGLCAYHLDAAVKRWGNKIFSRQGMA